MEEIRIGDIYALTDDESGEEKQFEIIDTAELDGKLYVAIVPADEDVEEYTVLRVEEDGEDRIMVTIDDDREWEEVSAFFDDDLMSEIDYDEEN